MIMALKDYQIETEITIFLGSNQKKYVLFYWQSLRFVISGKMFQKYP